MSRRAWEVLIEGIRERQRQGRPMRVKVDGNRIREERLARGMTQQGLANATWLTRQTINAIENSIEKVVDGTTAHMLISVLGQNIVLEEEG